MVKCNNIRKILRIDDKFHISHNNMNSISKTSNRQKSEREAMSNFRNSTSHAPTAPDSDIRIVISDSGSCEHSSLSSDPVLINSDLLTRKNRLKDDLRLGNGRSNSGFIRDSESTNQEISISNPSKINNNSVEEHRVLDPARKKLLIQIRTWISSSTREDRMREDVFLKLFWNSELLVKLFEVFDDHKEQKLNQDQWIELLKSRLNQFDNEPPTSQFGQRQVDFVELVESVAYSICGEEDISLESFYKIFRTKSVLNALFCLIDRDLDGIVTVEQVMEFISKLSSARSGSRLTKENISWLENLFRQYVGDEKEIRKEDFSKIIQTKNQFFTDRVFDIFDGDASGSISLQEFLDAMHRFTGENPEDKIKFLFRVYDVDGDGLIQELELEQVMRACMEENGMKFSDHQISELTTALFEDADVEGRGALTYEALKGQLEKHPGLLENLSISIERWLVPVKPKDPPPKLSLLGKLRAMKPHQFTTLYLKNNYVYVLWVVAFFLTNITLFVSRGLSYYGDSSKSWALIMAKCAGQCLNFNCTFIVVVMLRQSLTFLRARGASAYMPIDQHIYFHKMTGFVIFFFSLFHTVMHLVNIEVGLVQNPNYNNTGNWTFGEFLVNPEATMELKFGLINGCANLTGMALMLILSIMVLCSLPFVRRASCFEVFYWTHLLYTAFWFLLIFHAPNFWKWFIVPGIIFVVEQALRIYHWRIGRGKTYISSGILLPSKVTHLIIRRPPGFDFHPGDYVFVRIPQIAKYEWHPFTISSGPEQTDAMWLHIRAVGEWTNRLYEYFEQEQTNMGGSFMDLRAKKDAFTKGEKFTRSVYRREPLKQNTLTADPRTRPQFKSVGDSYMTLVPESDHSSVPSESSQELSSSKDDVMDMDSIIREKKLPILIRKHPLKSTKSTPDVFERITERERNLNLRQVVRSESVRSENPSGGHSPARSSSGSPFSDKSRDSSAALSLRYMRNKPKIIPLKTPSFDKGSEEQEVRASLIGSRKGRGNSYYSKEKQAEEGRAGIQSLDDVNALKGQDKESSACYELATTRVSRERLSVGKALEIYVDGPFGAPSSHIFRAQHAVLIGTGIGVTPFASILQSIMRRYWASRNTCPNCNYTWCSELPLSVLDLQKVDFFWINRDQRSFEWFVHLLSQLEIEQAELGGAMERFLDMHMYITSALQRTDMKAVGLQLALDLLHEKEKRDLITGLKTRTNAGRPNWNKIFKQLKDQDKGKITVFYCGPPTLARTLKIKCDEFGFSFRKELF